MVKHLTKATGRAAVLSALFLSMLAAPLAAAQGLQDPTRPPASMTSSQETSAAASAVEPVLQSVLVSPTRMVAIISGQTVKLGERFGDARVVKITETEVVLRNGQNIQVLKLFPNVEKKFTAGRPGSTADAK
jgi:MSHA biogenesis protein MshK